MRVGDDEATKGWKMKIFKLILNLQIVSSKIYLQQTLFRPHKALAEKCFRPHREERRSSQSPFELRDVEEKAPKNI